MVWITDRFPLWGGGGDSPPSNEDYQGGEQVPAAEMNYLWNSLTQLERETNTALTDIDSDEDGRVGAADTTQRIKDNDIDPNGDGVVTGAENATETYKDADLDTEFSVTRASEVIQPSATAFITQHRLADTETLAVAHSGIDAVDGMAVDAELQIVTITNGTVTVQQTFTSGTTTYQNTSGGEQIVGVRLVNTDTAEREYHTKVTTRYT